MKKAIFALVMLASVSAHAEFRTGNELHSQLNGTHGQQMLSLGYVMGVADALRSVTICPPETLTAGQASDMVKKYLEDNPAVRHLAGDAIVNRVLSSVWPCARRGNGV